MAQLRKTAVIPGRLDPFVERTVMGPGDGEVIKAYDPRVTVRSDIFQCPYCGVVSGDGGERDDVTCRGCGEKYFKDGSRLADHQDMAMQTEEQADGADHEWPYAARDDESG